MHDHPGRIPAYIKKGERTVYLEWSSWWSIYYNKTERNYYLNSNFHSFHFLFHIHRNNQKDLPGILESREYYKERKVDLYVMTIVQSYHHSNTHLISPVIRVLPAFVLP